MSDANPYSSPEANLEQSQKSFTLTGPKSVGIGRGWGWIAEGFGYFKRSPGAWILTGIIFFVIAIVLNVIPIIGQIAWGVTVYVWFASFLLGCHAQDNGQSFQVGHLFSGFRKPQKLMLLGVLAGIVFIGVMMVAIGPIYLEMMQIGAEPSPELAETLADPRAFWLPFLVAMLVLIPVNMAVFFAPALIAINDVPIIEALKLSFKGCLKNILPMLLYGIVAMIFLFIAAIPLGLGLLVMLPVLIASIYVAYKDIFIE